MALTSSQVLDQSGKPIRASDITLPRSHRKMLNSRWKESFLAAELEEMDALKSKGVIAEIEGTKVLKTAILINIMWVYDVKTDQQGYVIIFKARIVALGNHKRPEIDFHEPFAPWQGCPRFGYCFPSSKAWS